MSRADGGTWVELGDGRHVPEEFAATYWPPKGSDEPAWRMVFRVIDGAPQIRSVAVESTAAGREVQRNDLRRLPLGDILEGVVDNVAAEFVTGDDGIVYERRGGLADTAWTRETAAALRGAQRDARRKMTNDVLADVADVYEANPDDPIGAVADALGKARRTARLYVQRAREAGLLPQRKA